ncbi:MAG: flp2 [Gemmatimonadetes bacterium]|nr:flp2 [Gemmatimonadota bacterium]
MTTARRSWRVARTGVMSCVRVKSRFLAALWCMACSSQSLGGAGHVGLAGKSRAPEACAAHASEIRQAVLDVTTRQHNVGLSVAISRYGQIVFSEGFGFADLEDSVRVSPQTRFAIASVTKAFTGIALLKAVERGQIDLDTPIQRYVPSFPRKPGPDITARLLAAHLGGIRHWKDERSPALYARHFDDVQDILSLFAEDSLVAPAGSGYHYSSYGYDLLGIAIQTTAGRRFQDAVSADLISGLGLTHTQFDDPRRIIPLRSRHYSFYDPTTSAELAELMRVPDWDYSYNMAAGNMISTTEDLVRFGDAVSHPGLLSAQSLALLYRRPQIDTVQSSMSFGWFVSPPDTLPLRIHINGANAGIQAGLYVYPESRLVIALASNTWGRGSRSGELTGTRPLDLPSRIAQACGQ